MKNRNIVIYPKGSIDGSASAWVAQEYFKAVDETNNSFIPVAHGTKELPLIDVDHDVNTSLYLMDISFPSEQIIDFARLHNLARLVWVDQMPGANVLMDQVRQSMAELKLPAMPSGAWSDSKDESGCTLAWKFFFLDDMMPETLKYVQDRDSWTFRYPETRKFHAYAVTAVDQPERWSEVFDEDNLPNTLMLGEAITRYTDQLISRYSSTGMLDYIYTTDADAPIAGVSVNVPRELVSEVSNRILEEHPEIKFVLGYQVHARTIEYDLRSRHETEFNCKTYANIFGGGGRGTTAGFIRPRMFTSSNIPGFVFTKNSKPETKFDL